MTLKFTNSYIKGAYTLLGRNEHNIKIDVDEKITDHYNKEKSLELGESSYQIKTIKGLLKKEKLKESEIGVLISGDLQNQLMASNFAMRNFEIPHLGIYSACATFVEGLIIASLLTEKNINKIIVSTSSHNLVSEKQFRFPIEYGAIKKKINTFTATGSVSSLITKDKTNIKIDNATIGTVVDIGYKDTNNMGACMAPGAAKTIYEHLKDTKRKASYYDIILTGDLGVYGVDILKEYLKKEYKIEANNIVDSGTLLFEEKSGDIIAGGSGPVCLPLVLFSTILNKKFKKILLVGTGSLHSKLSANINESVPTISHAVSLEVIK